MAGIDQHKIMHDAVYGWKYRLIAAEALNRKSARRVVEGFLIYHAEGYGCVQPWGEFGHGSVDELWQAVALGKQTPLIEQALHCARIDGKARNEGVSLWQDISVPDSHATFTSLTTSWQNARDAGFTIAKIKASTEYSAELAAWANDDDQLRLRLDFNEMPSRDKIQKWLDQCPTWLRHKIDFLEDPFPYEADAWKEFADTNNITLALDRGLAEQSQESSLISVWKPAWAAQPSISPSRLLITSAMDHVIGQAWAAYQAGLHRVKEICGLRTEHLFETNEFSERMGMWSPTWPTICGTGLGFDDLLEKIPWTRIR
jgi:o-succinylbenzoate synthase